MKTCKRSRKFSALLGQEMTMALSSRMTTWVVGFILGTGTIVWGQVTVDDFLPPVQGGAKDVKKPQEVKTDGRTVSAGSSQDTINAAMEQTKQGVGKQPSREAGTRKLKFPSGLGFLATGAATYRKMENSTATRIAKRHAYVVAYIQAKKYLAEELNGLSSEGRDEVRQALTSVSLPKEDMTNLSTRTDESLRQTVDMMLRGFVIYEVTDDTAQNTVWVTIVTTPRTCGRLSRPVAHAITAEDLRDGLNQVIAEVKSGLVPPMGGRIIDVRSTGETAFVGFGSCVVRNSENSALQAKLNLDAVKIAGMRSKDALCGLVIGDRVWWSGGVTENSQDEIREFEKLRAGDPLASDPGVRKLDQARQAFLAKIESTDTYVSARRGILPPGITTRNWLDDDGSWAWSMAVYLPSASREAKAFADQMMKNSILKPVDSGGFIDETNPIKRPGTEVRPGPSGKVSPEGGL